MTQEAGRKNLGRGLSALLGGPVEEAPVRAAAPSPRGVPIHLIHPSPLQPRRRFDDEQLQALAASMRENGVLQPILVRPRAGQPNNFEIIAGERRWRAAQLAQLHEVPVVIREPGDRESLELAIVENVQRQDLSPLEEAEGYRRLVDDFHNTQDDLARRVGKSRSHVANTLRLLSLPESVRKLLDEGQLTAGHARALLNAADPSALAAMIVARGLNVRQAERLAKLARSTAKTPRKPRTKDADTKALERDLTARLGLNVAINGQGETGVVTIQYKTLEQLDLIVERLKVPPTTQF
ncbi:MAG: ParB/RepB/Spo0J family partition protein [Dongiaceae bacterium]